MREEAYEFLEAQIKAVSAMRFQFQRDIIEGSM